MKNIIQLLFIASTLLLFSCDKTKLAEGDLPSNQKLLSVCLTPWEQVVNDGSKIVTYENDVAKCGENCIPIEFECRSGTFVALKKNNVEIVSGESIDIFTTKSTCNKEEKCSCILPNNKGVLSHGITTQVFSVSQVACGDTCNTKKIDVLCENGSFVNPITKQPVSNFNFSCTAIECKSCTAPWDANLKAAHGGKLTGYINSNLGCGQTCLNPATNSIEFNCVDGILTRATNSLPNAEATLKSTCSASNNCTCRTTDGKSYSHDVNSTIKLFQKSSGTCASGCDLGSEYKCLDGVFKSVSTSATTTTALYQSCNDQCVYCDLPDATRIKQGATATLYKNALGTCTQSCEKMTVRCDVNTANNTGFLTITSGSGLISDYKVSQCSETCVTCTLPDGNKLKENQSANFYKAASISCGQTCQQGTLFCDKATASLKLTSGTGVVGDYKYSQCVNNCVQCDLPDGTKLDEGSVSSFKYSTSSVKCGETCSAVQARYWCLGGKLSFFGTATGSLPDYKYTSCTPEICKDCALPWDANSKLANNFTTTRYTKSSSVCGETCDNFKVSLKCTDSNLITIAGDPMANLANSFATCTNAVCPSCNFNGRVLNEGDKVIAYKNDGSSCAVGVCSDFVTLTCRNGTMTGGDLAVYKHGACQSSCVPTNKTEVGRTGDNSLEGGGANPWLCPVLHSRGFAWGGTKLTYYTKSRVACNDSCSKYAVTVECNNLSGLFTNSNRMLYLQCKEDCQ